MIKYFKKAFKITSENIILATPLILFLFFFNLYLNFSREIPASIFSSLLLVITILFMLSAFFAGWFFMAKKAVNIDCSQSLTEEEKAKASFDLIKEIPTGIGEYFLSFLGASVLYIILISILTFVTIKLGMHFIGKVNINVNQIMHAMQSSGEMKNLITSMKADDLIKLNKWNFLFLTSTVSLSFLTLFWPAQIIYKDKNPILALINGIRTIFSNFIESVILFIYISFINFFVSIVNTISMLNQILYFFSLLVYFYFIVYTIVLIFLYYDSKTKEKSYSDCRSDSIG